MRVDLDICYATVAGRELHLDLYRPDGDGIAPVVVYFHGGGWARGDKRDFAEARFGRIIEGGVAVASANYRLLPHDLHPAQVHDAKAAVRWLRANGVSRGIGAARVGAWGASAGGYLATMLGLTSGDPQLEGSLGPHQGVSSAVDAVVAWFTPFDLVASSRRSRLERQVAPRPYAPALFGRDGIENGDAAVDAANPCRRVHAGAPPFLIAHGDRDVMVPADEGKQLHAALAREGVDATLCLIGAAGHEDDKFHSPANLAMTASWLKEKLTDM